MPACALQQRGLDRALGCFPGVANALGFRVLIRMPLVRPVFGERLMPVGFGIQKGTSVARAFSSEVDIGSREENASKHKDRAPFRFNRNGKGSSPVTCIARAACCRRERAPESNGEVLQERKHERSPRRHTQLAAL